MKEDDTNNSHVNIKKKYFVISLILVSTISIILVTTSIVSFTTTTSVISSIDAQKQEPPPKSPSQLQAERQQQQQGQLLEEQNKKVTIPKPKPKQDQKECEKQGLTLCTSPEGVARCVDTQTDRANCGGCNKDNCIYNGGQCIAGTCKCPTGYEACGSLIGGSNPPPPGSTCGIFSCCAPISAYKTDPNNCGMCGNNCGSTEGAICNNGVCQCPAGQRSCVEGSQAKCVQLGTNENCADCDDVCTSSQTCQSGQCQCPSDKPTVCNDQCVNTQTDNNNCGVCGKVCASGASCTNSVCNCPSGQRVCGATPGAPGACTDVTSDVNNCGGCGNSCTASVSGSICQNNQCTCPAGQHPDGCHFGGPSPPSLECTPNNCGFVHTGPDQCEKVCL